jgi:hypothetical protein
MAMEEYRLPKPWYFAPAFRYEPNRFWGSKSLAAKMIQVQTVMNDAVTMAVVGAAAAAFPNVVTSGGMMEAQRVRMGIGNMIHLKNPVNMEVIGANQFNGGPISMLLELCERIADSIAHISQSGMGQDFSPNTTATAAAGAMQGQASGMSAVTDNFGSELVKMADFARYLIAIKWEEFAAYHTDVEVMVPDGQGGERPLTGADFVANYTIALNGSAGANPIVTVQKLQMLLQIIQGLAQQLAAEGKQLNAEAFFEAILNALDLPVNTSQLLLDVQQQGGLNGQNPQQLQQPMGGAGGGMAPGAMGGGTGGPAAANQPNGSGAVPGGGLAPPGGMQGV